MMCVPMPECMYTMTTSGTSRVFLSLMMEVFYTDEIGKEEIVVDGKDSKQAEKGPDEG